MPSNAQVELHRKEALFHRVFAPLSVQASAHLNMLRAVAAFVVLYGHWRSIFFVDWPQVHQRNLFLQLFYASSKFGHEAVVVFFVLSGYLIGRTVLRAVFAGKWSAKHYAFHRLIRLEIVLIPALCLCWLWDAAGIRLFSPSATYLGTGGSPILSYDISQWISLRIFFGNIAFLQTVRVTPFGSDNPLWSLANEFWYYALFPCLVIALLPRFSWLRRAVAVMMMIAICWFIGRGMLGGFFIWLLGVILLFLPRLDLRRPKYYWLLLLGTLILLFTQLVLTADPRQIENKAYTDYTLAIVVAILLYVLLHSPFSVSQFYDSCAKRAAGFSYTLYLTHLPVLVFCSAWMNGRRTPTVRNFVIPIAIFAATVTYSYGVAAIFEHNTDRVRKRLETAFNL